MLDADRIKTLLSKVPSPPGERLPEGTTDAEIHSFVDRTGISVPDDLAAWMKLSNGPCVGPGGLFGIRTQRSHLDIESCLDIFPSWRHQKWIPVAGDGCGNYYVVPTQGEFGDGFPVLFIDMSLADDSPAFIVASDMGHFLESLLETELGDRSWPFDERAVVERDPNILSFRDVKLPWSGA